MLGRPPGHHAGPRGRLREGNNGFCFFNNGALAVQALELEYALDVANGQRSALAICPRERLMSLLELAIGPPLAAEVRLEPSIFYI